MFDRAKNDSTNSQNPVKFKTDLEKLMTAVMDDKTNSLNHSRRSMFVKGIHTTSNEDQKLKYQMKNGRVFSFSRSTSVAEQKPNAAKNENKKASLGDSLKL